MFISFLKLNSNISKANLENGLFLKKIEDSDWETWFGFVVEKKGNETKWDPSGRGYFGSLFLLNPSDPYGSEVIGNNYALIADSDKKESDVDAFDQALRLFRTSNSGISLGYTKNRQMATHPVSGWDQLSNLKIEQDDLSDLEQFSTALRKCTNTKALMLVERYRHATQGNAYLKTHNRFLDFMIIFECLFVPQSNEGKIRQKLGSRGSEILSEHLSKSVSEIREFFDQMWSLRCAVVHDGENINFDKIQWHQIADYARTGVVQYILEPDLFNF